MHYIHYTKEFKDKIETDPKKELVYNKLQDLESIDKIEALNSIDSYAKGILVLKFIKANTCRIIIEPRWQEVHGNKVHVLYVRDFISKKSFDYFWGNVVHPQLSNGEWIRLNPLPEEEVKVFEMSFEEAAQNLSTLKRPVLPEGLERWLNEFKIHLSFDVYEREAWVLYSSNRSSQNGLLEKYILLFRDTLKAVLNENTNNKVIIQTLDSEKDLYSAVFEPFNIGLIYSDFRNIESRRVVVIHDGAHLKDQSKRWESALAALKSGGNYIEPNLLQISKDAFRAYPKWIVFSESDDLWVAIQRYEGSHNLSLLPEQVVFLNNFKFPAYINGQAGSGKSTMLYYLFANVLFYKYFGQINGEVIFLTENDHLLDHTAKSIIGLLSSNPEFSVGFSLEERNSIRKHFSSFKSYLLELLPDDARSQFIDSKFLDFAKFKDLFNSNPIANKRFSAEEAWFVISTYVYGYYEDKVIDTVEKYIDDSEGIPSKFRIVDHDTFALIVSTCLGFYRKLLDDGFWDKTRLVRAIRTLYPNFLPKQYTVVFCDEAQDFSRIELRLILQSSLFITYDLTSVDQIPIVFAGDALQTVSPTGFSDTRLHQMYYEAFSEVNFKYDKTRSTYNPTYNYRSSQPIVRLANIIQNYRKESLLEDVFIRQESKRALQDNPIPILHSKEWICKEENFPLFIKKFKYKSFILPVDLNEEEFYVKMDSLLENNFADVKSSIDAKGAEYSQVVVYGFGEYYLKEFQPITWTNVENTFKRRFFFNKLYVAITRAQNELVLIDSQEAIDFFWKPILSIPEGIERWEEYSDINDILPISPETGLQDILESSPDDALSNATLDMQQGINDENIGRLVVASNVFLMLGKIEEAHQCLGYKERIRKRWKDAGDHFLKAQKLEDAAEAFFAGKVWESLKSKTKSLIGNKQEVRLLVGKFMTMGNWTREELNKVYELKNYLSELMISVEWYQEFSDLIIIFSRAMTNSEEKRELVYILESIGKDDDYQLWFQIGMLYYETKKFSNAIEAWERMLINDRGVNYFPEFIRANIEKSRDEDDEISEMLWKGRLLRANIEYREQISLSKYLAENYTEKEDEIKGSEIRSELTSQIFCAAILLSNFDLINDVGTQVEQLAVSSDWLVQTYQHLLRISNDEFLSGFLKERWAKYKFKSFLERGETPESALLLLNSDFSRNNFKFETSNTPWTLEEVNTLPEFLTQVKFIPEEHFESLIIKNFRRFESIEVNNLGQFNIVVGNNNSGKTSFLEALLFSPDPDTCLTNFLYSIRQRSNNSDKDRKTGFDFLAYLTNKSNNRNGIEYIIKSGRRSWAFSVGNPTRSELQTHRDISDGDPKFYLGVKERRSRILISKKVEHVGFDVEQAEFLKRIPFIPFGKGYLEKLSSVYFNEIGSKRSLREEFISQMKVFIPNIVDISIDPETNTIIIEEDNLGQEDSYALHDYGEGANKLFRILVQLHAARNSRLMIDEIDAGIHYSRFAEFWRIILYAAAEYNVQVFVTTHSEEWLRQLVELLSNEQLLEYRDKSRLITLESHLQSGKIVPIVRDFPSIEYAFDNNLEVRGRKL